MEKEFNQKEYIKEWKKEHMLSVSARYNNSFVMEFREALKKLGLSQSDVIREAMQNIINKSKEM